MDFGFERNRPCEHPPSLGQWEFGSKPWCEACAAQGVKLLQAANLDLAGVAWAFSEIYTFCPERLLGGRDESSYYMMIKDGVISGGGGAPDECRALPGFHVKIPWVSIASQSAGYYGREGQARRSADEGVMWREITDAAGRKNPLGLKSGTPAVWPKAIGAALGAGGETGGGLHNITASMLIPSPEVATLPLSPHGVSLVAQMTEDQRAGFLALLGL
jgi:hypothetical protein